MEAQNETTSAISELINLKAKIEQENSDLFEEKEKLRDKLRIYQEEKESARRHNLELCSKNISLKLALTSHASKVSCLAKHIEWQRSLLDGLDNQIGEELSLKNFEEHIEKIRTSIEGAVSFYGEDSLQYELLQRTTANRDKRVELTRITSELEEKIKEIEAKKKQMAEAKAAEERRLKQEEERKKREEEEKTAAEKSKQRQQFMQQRVATFQTPQVNQSISFRPPGFNVCTPERQRQSFSSVGGMSSIGSEHENSADAPTPVTTKISFKGLPSLPTFSQLGPCDKDNQRLTSNMDAIKSVENEVDKVLRLFSTCRESCNNKIDQFIELVEKTKRDIIKVTSPDQTELSGQQINTIRNICDTLQKSCAQLTNSHRELHVPVSKIGKSIDKNFSPDFSCVADKKLFQSPGNKELLNLAIMQHLLRYGMTEVAKELIKEANLSVDINELAKFDEVGVIVDSLKRKNVNLALEWSVKNRRRLNALNSPLEFKIHRIIIIELYKQGVKKQKEALQYARENLQPFAETYEKEIERLMGCLIYLKSGIENSPYKSFLDPINYDEIEDIFISNACALIELSPRSPMSIAIDAGCVALPALLNINQILSNQGVQNVWQLRDELPVEIDLGRNLQFHSTFSCPILKQQSSEGNPPMRLLCGHVISRDALHKLSSGSTGNKLKCPYCPMEQVLTDAKQIHF